MIPKPGGIFLRIRLGWLGGMNLCAYVSGNPVNWVDQKGLSYSGSVFTPINIGGMGNINPIANLPGIIERPLYPADDSWHDDRNDHNDRISFIEAKETWNGTVPARFHRLPGWEFSIDNLGNLKFVSPDGHSELVFTEDGILVEGCLNKGTYNYFNPQTDSWNHFIYDMIPYLLNGNCPPDPCD